VKAPLSFFFVQSPSHRRRDWRSIGRNAIALALAATARFRWPTRWSLLALAVAAAMFGVALFLPRAWAPVQAALDLAIRAVLAGLTWLLLAAVFAAAFIPGRLLLAALRRDPLRRAREPMRTSYWEPLPPSRGPERFRRQF
jgi:hypothetical protein